MTNRFRAVEGEGEKMTSRDRAEEEDEDINEMKAVEQGEAEGAGEAEAFLTRLKDEMMRDVVEGSVDSLKRKRAEDLEGASFENACQANELLLFR